MSDFLSFRLRDEFIDNYRGREPEWGFPMGAGNTLGQHSWLTKYARKKPDGTRERFWEGLERVVNGYFSIQKDHALQYKLPWNEEKAHASAQDAYERVWAGKWCPPGRGFWTMGTELVNGRKDSSALQNCSMVSTAGLADLDDPSMLFSRAMDMLMCGIGVGYDTLGAGKISLHEPVSRFPHTIGDSREGWCESFGALLRAFLLGTRLPVFDYSRIRPAGTPIKGFGGSASGPDPLRKLHEQVTLLLSGREGKVLTSTDIVDLMCLAGKCVVAGNVRRSAEIALGLPDDEAFLELKNWEANPVRMGRDGWGHISNNSVIAQVGGDYSHLAKRIALNGEPGLLWLDVAQKYGRLGDPPDNKDWRAAGVNPCLAGDTWVMTTEGSRQIRDLCDNSFWAVIDGQAYRATAAWSSGIKETFLLRTREGYEITLTEDHKVRRADGSWTSAADLIPGDKISLGNHRGMPRWGGPGTWGEGYLCGLLRGDGGFENTNAVVKVWHKDDGSEGVAAEGLKAAKAVSGTRRSDWSGWRDHNRGYRVMTLDKRMIARFGMAHKGKPLTDLEGTSTEFHRGFLRGFFDTDGHVEGWQDDTDYKGASVRLSQSDHPALVIVQRMLLKLGIKSRIYKLYSEGTSILPDGKGGTKEYPTKASWRLVIGSDDVPVYAQLVGFSHTAKAEKLVKIIGTRKFYAKPFCATVMTLETAGAQEVYDLTVDKVHNIDANGINVSNCGEQPLEHMELCTLVETFPTNCDDLPDYLRSVKAAYLYAKSVTLLMTKWPETNEVMIRNRRIGTSMSGIAMFAEEHGWTELRRWQEAGYQEVRKYDRIYSEWLGVRESIRCTTVKPSGTVSLLFGVTPGVHWPRERGFYVRTIRDLTGSPFARVMEEAGYPVEPSVMDPDSTVVITLPVEGPDIRPEREVSAWEKTALAVLCQRHWSDNAVSCTITFSEDEAKEIPAILRAYDGQLKSASFLPIAEGTYQQAPYQRVTREYWEELRSRIKPLDWDSLYGNPELAEAEGENYCTTDTCEVPR